MEDHNKIIIPKKVSTENSEYLLNSFRKINKIVRLNHSSDLKFRMTHQPRFGFEEKISTLPSANVSRAPILTNKIQSIDMCLQLIARK